MFAARRLVLPSSHNLLNKKNPISIRQFHSSIANMVKAGDSIPNVELVEGAPDKKVNLAKELATGKGVIVGVPAAFSEYIVVLLRQVAPRQASAHNNMKQENKKRKKKKWKRRRRRTRSTDANLYKPGPTCSASHVPGYIANKNLASKEGSYHLMYQQQLGTVGVL